MKKKDISKAASLMAKKAGDAVFKKYGRAHYIKMANKRWAKVKAQQATKK